MTAGWCSRTLRAAVFAAVCVVLAALGHVMMSGESVPWWTLAGGFGATGGLGWCLAGRERGRGVVVAVVVAAQAALHSGFTLVQSLNPEHTEHIDHSAYPEHPGHHMASADMGPGPSDMGHSGFSDVLAGDSWSLGMLAAHLLAALLTGLWLAHGERAAFRILRAVAGWLTAPLRLLLALPAPGHRPRLRGRRRPSSASRLLPLVHVIVSRGPPVGSAVA
ncbi:hypothetical protein ABZ532_26430 [Streptomyces sp. NPDC019396]|uniref:hypothetical protein n=1 Tax=Streptomyces sp. NPDC019396 TaxID=3154687 RepID=UPI00340F3C5F